MVRVLIGKEGDAPPTKEEVLQHVEADVEAFSAFMATLEDARARGALSNPEKALIRTYLIQKSRGKL